MAKVKLFDLMRNADMRSRGRFNIAATAHGAVAKTWPKKRGKAKSGYDFYRQKEFGWAAKYASTPFDLDYFTAFEMAKGTEQVPRDILMMASMGYYYELVYPDGDVARSARELTNNVQYVLDLLDPEIGAIAVRREIGWIALSQGTVGQVLTTLGDGPGWAAPQGGGSIAAAGWIGPGNLQNNTTNVGTRIMRFRPAEHMTIDAVKLRGLFNGSTAIQARCFESAGSALGALLFDTGSFPITTGYQGDMVMPLSGPFTFVGGQEYYLCAFDPTRPSGQGPRIYLADDDIVAWPLWQTSQGGQLASTDPQPGDLPTFNNTIAGFTFHIKA